MTNSMQLKLPPAPLKSARVFARHIVAAYPVWLIATWVVAAKGASVADPKVLSIVGAMSAFFSAGLLAWQSFWIHKAKAVVAECTSYNNYLNSQKHARDPASPVENAQFLKLIGERRAENLRVQECAEGYEATRQRLSTAGFFILGVATLIQVASNVVA